MSKSSKTTYGRSSSKVIDEACTTYKPKESDVTGNIITFTLIALCILLAIFISIGYFFIAKSPTTSLTSASLSNLSYNKSYFNATLVMQLRVENPNFGFFEFPTSKGDILYNGRLVGEMKVKGQRVDSYSATRTEVETEVSYRENQTSSVWFKNDLERGLVILKFEAKLRGEVHLKALNKRTVNLNCLIHLKLIDKVIQHLWCK